ncbi:MAG TPA: SDR family oxidoreductase [Chloroflexota bacterium]|nr:SDR family oxidoreductase [Chloroflexota bacterium]
MSTANRPEVVVVTGAGAGLGRAIVQEFAKHGANVGLLSRGKERLEDARRDVEAAGGRAVAVPTDVADAAAVEAAAAQVEETLGPIDIWVNDAMTTVFSPVKEMTADDYKRVTEVTYLGFVYGTLAALKRMQPRDRGVIVQVGSALAYRSIPLQSAYCAAKHAMVGFTDSLRSELIHDGSHVRVTVVHMPALNTPQFSWCKSRMPRKPQPVPPIFQPEVGARAVYWAAHHSRRELLVGWPTVQAVWGQKFLAGWLDHYLAKMAWDGQMYDGPRPADTPIDLWEPVPGHQGAHGAFDERARDNSPELWASTHAGWLGAAAAAAALLGIAAWRRA